MLAHRSLPELPEALFLLPSAAASAATSERSALGRVAERTSEAEASVRSRTGPLADTPPILTFLLSLVADQFIENHSDATSTTLLSCRSLWRSSQVRNAFASETVVLLRRLAAGGAFDAGLLGRAFSAMLGELPSVVASLTSDPSAMALRQSGDMLVAMLSLGALCVLGGSLPALFVGGRVVVEAEGGDLSAGSQEVRGLPPRGGGSPLSS